MPMVLAAAAGAVTFIGGAGAALTGLVATPFVGLLGEGAAIALAGGLLQTAGVGLLSAGINALAAPKVGRGGSPTAFKADPNAPIRGVMGYVGVGGTQLHMRSWGKENVFLSFVTALSLGPIGGIGDFKANGEVVTFGGPQGMASNTHYANRMWMTSSSGLPTDAALRPPSGQPQGSPSMDEWTAAHKTSGHATAFWTLRTDSKRAAYPTGVPMPQWTLLGMKLWDPRFDDTYPGGAGPQRRDDWRTWVWSENPYIHALAWTRGHFKLNADGSIDRTKRLAGIGAPDRGIDIAAFCEGANVAAVNNWPIAGEWTTADDKWSVLAAMLQAGGGEPLNRGAQISCLVNTPRASILTLTRADLAGAPSLKVMKSRRDRFNTVIPRYRSVDHRWEVVSGGAVTSSVYVDEDRGEPRSREIEYGYACRPKQAAELAAYDLVNARESLEGGLPCKPYLLGLRAGDAFTVDEPEMGLAAQKFIVRRRAFDPQTVIVDLEIRSETDAKHDFALGRAAAPPPSPTLSPVDPIPQPPDPEDWVVIVRPPDAGGTSQPGLTFVGAVSNGRAARVLVEYGPSDEGPWTQAYDGPPTTEQIEVTGLEPGATYWAAVSYQAIQGGVWSEKTVYGPLTVGDLTAGNLSGPGRAALIAALLGQLDDTAAAERFAETLIQTILDEQESYEFEAERRLDADTGVLNQATSHTDNAVAEAMNLVYTRAQTDSGLASTLQVARSYTDTRQSEAELLFSTKAERANGDALAVIQAKAYTDDYKSEASISFATQAALSGGLATTLSTAQSYTNGSVSTALSTVYTKAQVDGGLATTLQQARSHTDILRSDANLTFATTAALGGVSSTASLALSSAVAANGTANATFGLALNVQGYVTGFQSTNTGSFGHLAILSDILSIVAPNGGARAEYRGGIWYFYPADNSTRSMVGKPFGGGYGLTAWTGPNSVAEGSESKANAYVYTSTNTFGGPRFGGSDVAGGAAPLQATASAEVAYGSSPPGGGFAGSQTITITPTGQGAGSATCRWTKVDGGDVGINANGFSASFFGTVPPGGLLRAFYLAVVYSAGQSVTLLVDVQLSDPN